MDARLRTRSDNEPTHNVTSESFKKNVAYQFPWKSLESETDDKSAHKNGPGKTEVNECRCREARQARAAPLCLLPSAVS